jgi:hypothetical protein
MLRSALRYCVAASVAVLMSSPLGEGPGCAAAARHWAGLMVSDMLLLRQVGALGLALQVMAALEKGGAARDELAALLEEVRGAGGGGSGEACGPGLFDLHALHASSLRQVIPCVFFILHQPTTSQHYPNSIPSTTSAWPTPPLARPWSS